MQRCFTVKFISLLILKIFYSSFREYVIYFSLGFDGIKLFQPKWDKKILGSNQFTLLSVKWYSATLVSSISTCQNTVFVI